MALAEQQAHTAVGQDTLLHWETLFVIRAIRTSVMAHQDHTHLPLIAQRVSGHFSGHALLIECSKLPVAGNEMFSCKMNNNVLYFTTTWESIS
uniref:Uncharacterized protein n=1 Tax=Periophthalmus magnuspinnatus TaxID=409849 RepID=A0A3B4B1Z9_9GOBI